MRRRILLLMVSAMLLAILLVSGGLPAAIAQEAPGAPQCGWYLNWWDPARPWWEYWCWWPGWGWQFVFWVWA